MSVKNADPLTAAAQGITSFINRILIGHPCTVLRRQCQVHNFAKKSHLTPFTLVPSVCHIITKDGIFTLWKGSVGSGVLWAMSQITEIVIADIFGLPKNIISEGSRERFWRHVLLKAGSYFVMTPFIVSSFVETVRSNTGISTEDTRILDVIVRGFDRLHFDFFGTKDSSRRFSLCYLSVPTVGYYTSHFLVSKFTYDNVYGMARRYVSRKMPHERTRFHSMMPDMIATITSQLIADLVCYPLETILHRLYIQGTRTLIDNLDNGVSAISITAKYQSFVHCFQSIINKEGFSTLFTGIGAIVLQYSLQFCVLNIVRAVFSHRSSMALHINTSSRNLNNGSSILSSNGQGSSSATHPSLHNFSAPDSDLSGTWAFTNASGYPSTGPNRNAGSISPIFARESSNVNSNNFGQPFNTHYSNLPDETLGGSITPPNYSSFLLQTHEANDRQSTNLFYDS